jgi:hypothetical protein
MRGTDAAFSDYNKLRNYELDGMFGRENRKRLRELTVWKKEGETEDSDLDRDLDEANVRISAIKSDPNFKPWKTTMTRQTRRWSLGALSMTDSRGKDFFKLYENFELVVRSGQISTPDNTPESLQEDAKVMQTYIAFMGDFDLIAGINESWPPNGRYELWHWQLNQLRPLIAKATGLDTKTVDRVLSRLGRKFLKRESRFRGESRAPSETGRWHKDQESVPTDPHDDLFWTKPPNLSSSRPVPYRF